MGDIIDNIENVEEVKTMFIESVQKYKKKVFQEGIRKNTVDTAINMLQMGMTVEVIAKVTGLSPEEIEGLRLN